MMIARRSLMLVAAGFVAPPASAAQDRFFDSAGVRVRFIEGGRGEPVILVHGYTTDTEEQFVRPGVFAATQTLGQTNRRRERAVNVIAYAVSAVITVGFLLVPLSIAFGLID